MLSSTVRSSPSLQLVGGVRACRSMPARRILLGEGRKSFTTGPGSIENPQWSQPVSVSLRDIWNEGVLPHGLGREGKRRVCSFPLDFRPWGER